MIKIQPDWMSSLMGLFYFYLCCQENGVGHTTYDICKYIDFLIIFEIYRSIF